MDWSGCEFVVAASVPFILDTRTSADEIIFELKSGMSWSEIIDKHQEIPANVTERVLCYGAERLAMDEPSLVDWSGCALVERVPGKLSGAPAIVGTRIFADTIAMYYWEGVGVDEIVSDYPSLSRETVAELIGYVEWKDAQAA